jgi:hypothetical protein
MKHLSVAFALGVSGVLGFIACGGSIQPDLEIDAGHFDSGGGFMLPDVGFVNHDTGGPRPPTSGFGSGTSPGMPPPGSGTGTSIGDSEFFFEAGFEASDDGSFDAPFDDDVDSAFDAGPPLPPLQCTILASAGSMGACVTETSPDASVPVTCNPVTNEPCAAGEACDVSVNETGSGLVGFTCYPPPPPNTVALCGACDDQSVACVGGSTCWAVNNGAPTGSCAKYCCTDADCGSGTCTSVLEGAAVFPAVPGLGLCTEAALDAGVGSGSGS